ncbi:MAG: DUF59 domain-containing protein [Bacteroidia bacterium]|nr:DUF59 domain-containing protein [Bacteroidia bacterium]
MAEEIQHNLENAEELDPGKANELKEHIKSVISTIYDPEIPVDIYQLGLIYDIQVLPLGKVWIQMTLTSPNCPAAASLPAEVETKVSSIPGVEDIELDLTFDPPWSQEMMSEEAKFELGFI